MRYNFEWDPKKAKINIQNHKISFERSAAVFRDPNAITIFDEEHTAIQKVKKWRQEDMYFQGDKKKREKLFFALFFKIIEAYYKIRFLPSPSWRSNFTVNHLVH